MQCYKSAYYKIFIGLCKIQEKVEELAADKKIEEGSREKINMIVEEIKEVQREGEEEIIRNDREGMIVQTKYNNH